MIYTVYQCDGCDKKLELTTDIDWAESGKWRVVRVEHPSIPNGRMFQCVACPDCKTITIPDNVSTP